MKYKNKIIETKKPLTDEEIEQEYISWLKEIEQNGDWIWEQKLKKLNQKEL